MASGRCSRFSVRLLKGSVRYLQTSTSQQTSRSTNARVRLVATTAASAVIGYFAYKTVSTSSLLPSASSVAAAKVHYEHGCSYALLV